jgi:hypothetical protein
MASIRSKHNNLLNYFLYDEKLLSKAYVRKCKKFLNNLNQKCPEAPKGCAPHSYATPGYYRK